MRNGLLAVLGLCWGIACSSNDKSAPTCQELQTKLSKCGLVATMSCNATSSCDLRCATNATCDELKAMPPSGAYLDCQAACAGIGPNPFVCANGTQFVDRKGVCDGVAACRDGSDEANCGAAGSNAGGATAAGGAGNGGGDNVAGRASGGGGAPASDAGNTAPASPECQAMVDNELAGCSMLDRTAELGFCSDSTDLYTAEGCGREWNAYLVCMAKAPLKCDTTTTGCENVQTGYFMCQSQFALKTSCVVQGKSPDCPAGKPYRFSCLGSVPATCDQVSTGNGVVETCCPAFPAM